VAPLLGFDASDYATLSISLGDIMMGILGGYLIEQKVNSGAMQLANI
jgi:hypothetical protein